MIHYRNHSQKVLSLSEMSRIVIFLFSFFLILSCGNPDKVDNSLEDEIIDQEESMQDEEDNDFSYMIPSPLQIASILKKSGLSYESGLTNATSKSSTYTSSFSKTINFGVYSADLAYCVLNNQPKESVTYLKVVKQLADDLGFASIFKSGSLLLSFEKNLGNEDSLINVLVTLQEELDSYLEDNEQKHTYPVVFAGAWVESVYIGSKVLKDGNSTQLTERILEQMNILKNVIYGLKKHPNKDENITTLINDLESVKNIFHNISSIKGKDLEDPETFENISISPEEFEQLSNRVESIRINLTN